MITSTILNNLSAEQISSLFQGLQDQLTDIKQNLQPKEPVEYLTRKEVAAMLKCDLSTLHNWVIKGKLIPYGIGNRVYFKRQEIEQVLVPLRKIK